MPFLPTTKEELKNLPPDYIIITGDAYVDHPSFGAALISRLIESLGFTVGIIAQPQTESDYNRLGIPRYAFLITSGNLDSMVANYTVALKKRTSDYYSPGGKAGLRPDRAVSVYTRQIKRLFPDTPVIIGGLEASLRRFAHYDYHSDSVRPSILYESGADMLVYGMGEHQTKAIVTRLAAREGIDELRDIPGTCFFADEQSIPLGAVRCGSLHKVSIDKEAYARSFKLQAEEHDYKTGKALVQKHDERYLVVLPPAPPLNSDELDRIATLPYMRAVHPMYKEGVPAIEEVLFSVMNTRGCFGGCNFCSLAFHQGRYVTARSERSVIREVQSLTKHPDFKGYIHDVGGPTANFTRPSCEKQRTHGMCRDRRCLAPLPCKALVADETAYLSLLRKLRELPGVKAVFVRSGIRYDYMLLDKDDTFFKELVRYHVSGQLKVAPEHCCNAVLDCMGKPHIDVYKRFAERFYMYTKSYGKKQYLVPYLMSSHPGSTLKHAVELALFLREQGIKPEQVQDFYPTPGTVSTCMYYTGIDPMTGKPVYIAKSSHEKALQRALLQYHLPKNRSLVAEALQKAGRPELINTLIPQKKGVDKHKTQKKRP